MTQDAGLRWCCLAAMLLAGCQTSGKTITATQPFKPYQPPARVAPAAAPATEPCSTCVPGPVDNNPPTIVMPQVPGGATSGIHAPTLPSTPAPISQSPRMESLPVATAGASDRSVLPVAPPTPAVPPEITGPVVPPVASSVVAPPSLN